MVKASCRQRPPELLRAPTSITASRAASRSACNDLMRWICLSLALALAPVPVHAGKIYGLVIGIDEYQFIPDLNGAVNDARDIEDALTGIGAKVTTLLDGAASRDTVLSEWRRLATSLQPDDQLIVTYAGHGSNEPEAVAGSELDGRDENLLLAGFSPYGASAGERIRDDEIAELLGLSRPGQVIFVADACHSGTLSRNLQPALGYRYVAVNGLKNDPLPPPPPRAAERETREQTALFLAAADDSEKTPEFLTNGVPRGALSYSFAASIRGLAADDNQDDRLTKGEIETFVRRKVRSVSQGSQRPQVSPSGQSDALLFAFQRQLGRIPDQAASLAGKSFDALPPVTFFSDGAKTTGLDGIQLVSDPAQAEIRLNAQTGALHSMVGDEMLRLNPTDPAYSAQKAIDKMRLVEAMASYSGRLDIGFAEGDRTYISDEIVRIEALERSSRHIALLNIAANGEMSFLYPLPGLGDPSDSPSRDRLGLPVQVKGPYGADHVMAIETATPATELLRVLKEFDGTDDLEGFWEAFRRFASQAQDRPTVAAFPFHTAASREG